MSQKQDKARIYNSKEWRDIRNAKKQRNPLCELCLEEGIAKAADCVHHVIPIETANNFAQMKELAFRFSNLQSLCYAHHSAVHQQLRSRSKEGHQRASQAALDRWIAKHDRPTSNEGPNEKPSGPRLS
jgi:5-methylcytosine-specific restriction endonuclease McrA